MTLIQILAILLTATALFSYVNHRFIRLPTTIGVMLISLVVSLVLLVAGKYTPDAPELAADMLRRI